MSIITFRDKVKKVIEIFETHKNQRISFPRCYLEMNDLDGYIKLLSKHYFVDPCEYPYDDYVLVNYLSYLNDLEIYFLTGEGDIKSVFLGDIEKILDLIIEDVCSSYLFFWGPIKLDDDQFKVYLKPSYISTFTFQGKTFVNTEHFIAYEKALFFEDFDLAKNILETKNYLLSLPTNFDYKEWDKISFNITFLANFLKFSGNPALAKYLISISDKEIIWANPMNREWGIGFAETEALQNRNNWGENKLGKILNMVANKLKS